MNTQHTTILVMLFTITVCSAYIGGGQAYQDVNPQVYCGRTLARALALICYDETKSDKNNKRSETGTMYNAILSPFYKEQESPQFGWPWMAPHKARGLALPSRGKRFVVNECCDKACSVEELISYC